MTSAPSLLQRLNGNKWLLAFLVFGTFSSSFAAKKDTASVAPTPMTISFLLPLNLDQLDTLNPVMSGKAFKGNTVGLDCWQGAKLALDSLSNKGLHLVVNVFDTERKGFSMSNGTLLDALGKSNLVIGPVYPELFLKAANFSKIYKIPVVSPLAPAPLDNYNDASFIGMYPTIAHHAKADALYVSKTYSNANIIIVHTGDPADDKLAKPFSGFLFGQKKTAQTVKLQKATPDFKQLQAKLSLNKPNILLVPTLSNTFLTQFYSHLHTDSLHEIHVFTHPNFNKLDKFNLDLIQSTNTYTSSANTLDYNDPQVLAFVRHYRSQFLNDPTDEAARMYNVVLFWGSQILAHDNAFLDSVSNSNWRGLYGKYHFRCDSNGCHNTAVDIYKYVNFDLIKQE